MTGRNLFPKDWYRHPEKLDPVWDWEYHWGYTKAEHDKVWAKITKKGSRFWYNLPLMPLAKDSLFCLNRMQRYEGHDVYFLTHRPGWDAKHQTERWLYQYGLAYPTVLIVDAAKKYSVLKALGADIFIDDKLDTIRSAVGHATRVYLQDAPHNQVPVMEEKHASYTRVKRIPDMLKLEGLWSESDAKRAMFWRK